MIFDGVAGPVVLGAGTTTVAWWVTGLALLAVARHFVSMYREADAEFQDVFWRELADPLSFFVGAFVKLSDPAAKPRVNRLLCAVVAAGTTFAFGALSPLFSHENQGDPTAFVVTLFVAGAITFVPGEIAALPRRQGAYPKTLRTVMWVIEGVIVIAILAGRLSPAISHDKSVLDGVASAVIYVCLGELVIATACVELAQNKQGIAREGREAP